MRSRLLNELAMLASERFQERYVVNGTKEQYALPDEILDAALSSARNSLQSSSTTPSISPTEAIATREFVAVASTALSSIDFQDTTVSNRQLIGHDERWAAARLAARRLLSALGFDLEMWERQQGLR